MRPSIKLQELTEKFAIVFQLVLPMVLANHVTTLKESLDLNISPMPMLLSKQDSQREQLSVLLEVPWEPSIVLKSDQTIYPFAPINSIGNTLDSKISTRMVL